MNDLFLYLASLIIAAICAGAAYDFISKNEEANKKADQEWIRKSQYIGRCPYCGRQKCGCGYANSAG